MPHGELMVKQVQFSNDGNFVLTMSRGIKQPRVAPFGDVGAAQVWSAATGAPVTPRLPDRRRLTSARFHPKTQAILTASEDGSARICWSLAADTRPVEDLERLAQVLACRKIDLAGDLVPVPQAELQAMFQELRDRYPQSFACTAKERGVSAD
jgi:hypothetical protein